VLISAALFAHALPGAATAARGQSSLPAALESFLTNEARGNASDRAALLAGEPVIKLLDADPTKEVAVFGAVWVNAPSELYFGQLKNIEQFEQGKSFLVTKRISDPPRADDFVAMSIPDQDFKDLKDCQVGHCVIRLDAAGVRTLQAEVDWTKSTAKADANAVFRRLALRYVQEYREGGNAKLAIYRNSDRPTFVADEFRSMIDRLPRLGADLPALKHYLLEYPEATLPNSTDFLYWQEVQFGLKPTIRINHLIMQDLGDEKVVASKLLYASHYFWTALELRVLLGDPARGPGFWFVMVTRGRSGGLGGFTGRIIRGRVQSEAQNGTRAALTATKTKLESLAVRRQSLIGGPAE
jgi:hypothetical protein